MKKHLLLVAVVAALPVLFAPNASAVGAFVPYSTTQVNPPWVTNSGVPDANVSTARMLADATGDGKSDAILITQGKWYVAASTGAAFSPYSHWISNFGPYQGVLNIENLSADVNADGKADAVEVYQGYWLVALSTGSGFTAPVIWRTGFGQFGNGTSVANLLSDVNGDGKADAVFVSGTSWQVAYSTGNGFGTPTTWSSSAPTGSSATNRLGDVNGDGRADAVSVASGTWKVALSSGANFGAWNVWISSHPNTSDVSCGLTNFLADANGDGAADAIAVVNGGWRVALSTDTSFEGPAPTWLSNYGGNCVVPSFVLNNYSGDVTGDGKTDALAELQSTTTLGNLVVAPSVNATDALKPPAAGWHLAFGDEFNGTSLDTSNWSNQRNDWTGDSVDSYAATHPGAMTPAQISLMKGWPYNGDERAWYLPENVTVSGGSLSLTVRNRQNNPIVPFKAPGLVTGLQDQYNFSTGMISGSRLRPFKYGYVEARIKAPTCSGCWPAFWMLPSEGATPPEIDIFEFFPNQPPSLVTRPQSNVHAIGQAITPSTPEGRSLVDYRSHWHTYGMLWTQDKIQIYVDGELGKIYPQSYVPQVPMYLALQAAIAKNADGYVFSPEDGRAMTVDYVRVYSQN